MGLDINLSSQSSKGMRRVRGIKRSSSYVDDQAAEHESIELEADINMFPTILGVIHNNFG